jgi:hypothetical protein
MMKTENLCLIYRVNWEIFKGLLGLNLILLKYLFIWAQLASLHQG